MAAYGPNAGFVPFTGFSPTLGTGDASTPSTSGSAQMSGLTQSDGEIARILFQKGNRVVRALLNGLIGTVVGSNCTETNSRVLASTPFLTSIQGGGLRTIEAVDLINRTTVTLDDTNLTALITRSPVPSSYVADASGNGGGGKLGF